MFHSGKTLGKMLPVIHWNASYLFMKAVGVKGWKKSDINSLCWLLFAEFSKLL